MAPYIIPFPLCYSNFSEPQIPPLSQAAMDAKLHSLPPLKRFRLLHQLEEESILPSKKRNLSRKPPLFTLPTPTHFSLPAKKRIRAISPRFTPPSPTHLSLPTKKRIRAIMPHFDLNVEYSLPSPLKTDSKIPICHRDGEIEVEKSNPCEISQEEEMDEEDGILCAVCESTDGDPEDPIVFCDGCDLMVHASCYGNPLVKGIPQGDWFCAKCSVSKPPEKCCLCPVSGGALKPTTNGKWAHIICALLVPEVFFEDPEGREGINCEEVPKKRWREGCYVCNSSGRKGCVVDCGEPKCELAFHVSCGLKEDLCIELKEGKSSRGIVVAFCKEHTQLWNKQQETGKFKIVARE